MTKPKTIMPQYRIPGQDNQLYALRIKSVKKSYSYFGRLKRVIITPREEGYEPFEVEVDLFKASEPEVGWYYVKLFGFVVYMDSFWFSSSTAQVNSGS